MHRHKLTAALVVLVIFFHQPLVAAEKQENLAPLVDLVKIGGGDLRYFVWHIYTAELYAQTRIFHIDKPYALRITYARKVSKARLIQSTKSELRHHTATSENKISRWMEGLNKLWRDVKKNDALTLSVDKHQRAHFYLNNIALGSINDPEFTKAFSSIWLAENTSKPDLRAALLNL